MRVLIPLALMCLSTPSVHAQWIFSRPNMFGGQDYSDGSYTKKNILGGFDHYDRQGRMIDSSKRNSLGGYDYSNRIYSKPNSLGGLDYHGPGISGLYSKPNSLGGFDYSNGAYSKRNVMGGQDIYLPPARGTSSSWGSSRPPSSVPSNAAPWWRP
ncbi:MAG: hypothetical protein KatS3mg114_0237 [Planctomycetaceae bacterium]|nr:MAG: hypothetical protein KatS3mg114_0237 [Planctomycetaceae bacterium]